MPQLVTTPQYGSNIDMAQATNPALSERARLCLALLRKVWGEPGAGQVPNWVEPLCTVPMTVPAALRRIPNPHSTCPMAARRLETVRHGWARQWWSGGSCLYGAEKSVATFFGDLFDFICRAMRSAGPDYTVSLSRADLFHGHLFVVAPCHRSPPNGTRGAGANMAWADLGVVMHAKEFPSDLISPAQASSVCSNFNTSSQAYRSRNILWLASSNTVSVVRPPLHSKWEALLQLGTEWRALAPSLRCTLVSDYGQAPHRTAYTLCEAAFRELSGPLWYWNCDVNLLIGAPRADTALKIAPADHRMPSVIFAFGSSATARL